MTDAEVVVAGGGPVGLVAAIEARLAGMDVVLVEPRVGAIDKACGEGLMPGALPLLGRLGVAPHGMAIRGILYTDGRRQAEHRFARGVGLGVRRTVLQQALAERADALGVRRVEARVTDIVQDADGVTAAGIRARWLLAADGLHSPIARELGVARPAPRRRRRFGLRRHFRVRPWSELVEVHWTPIGEIYVTPIDDRLVGIAALVPQGVPFERVLAAAPAVASRLEADEVEPADSLLGAGPFRQSTSARVAGRVLLVGDSSGYVDAITGEGLRLGFAEARAAVARIAENRPDAYEADWTGITREFRRLTRGLVVAAQSPARGLIVPAAARLPRVFAAAVDRIAG